MGIAVPRTKQHPWCPISLLIINMHCPSVCICLFWQLYVF